jgi:hypothetical protein
LHLVLLENECESVGVVLRGQAREIEGGRVETWLLQPQPQGLVKPNNAAINTRE